MELINKEDIKYVDLFLNEKTGLAIKTVAKVQIDSMPVYTIDDIRPQAHWNLAEDGDGVICSCCGTDFCIMVFHTEEFKFCPNCGAKLDNKIVGIDLASGKDFSIGDLDYEQDC